MAEASEQGSGCGDSWAPAAARRRRFRMGLATGSAATVLLAVIGVGTYLGITHHTASLARPPACVSRPHLRSDQHENAATRHSLDNPRSASVAISSA